MKVLSKNNKVLKTGGKYVTNNIQAWVYSNMRQTYRV